VTLANLVEIIEEVPRIPIVLLLDLVQTQLLSVAVPLLKKRRKLRGKQ
jgi:hypothetical protein